NQHEGVIARHHPPFFPAANLNFEQGFLLTELRDIRLQYDLDAPLLHGFLEFALVVLEEPTELTTAIGKSHAVLIGEHQRRLDRAISTAHDEQVFVPIVTGAVEAVIDVFAGFTGDIQLAWIATLAGGQHDAPRAILALLADHAENAVALPLKSL